MFYHIPHLTLLKIVFVRQTHGQKFPRRVLEHVAGQLLPAHIPIAGKPKRAGQICDSHCQ